MSKVWKITHCELDLCKKTYYNLVTDNRIYKSYIKDNKVFLFLIKIFIAELCHPKVDKIFLPLPFVNGVDNIKDLHKKISHNSILLNEINLIKTLSKCENNLEFNELIGSDDYCLIKNAISNNYLFHESSIYSWYPIIKNGLKVISSTDL